MAEYKVNVYIGIDKQPTHGGSLKNCKEFISKRIIRYNMEYKNPRLVFHIYKKGNDGSWNHHCAITCIYNSDKETYDIINNRFGHRTLSVMISKYDWEMRNENIEYIMYTLFTSPEKFYDCRKYNINDIKGEN